MVMEYTRLYLIRHGQVQGFETPRLNGHTDVDLTPWGRIQLEAVARHLSDVHLDQIFSSDLRRARYGGEVLAQEKDLELRIDPGFRELHFGRWEGLTFDEINERFPGQMEERRQNPVHYRVPGGETLAEFWERIAEKKKEVLTGYQGLKIAVVAHSGVNRAIILQTLGLGPEAFWRVDQDFGCLNIVDFFSDGLGMVRLVNGPNQAQAK